MEEQEEEELHKKDFTASESTIIHSRSKTGVNHVDTCQCNVENTRAVFKVPGNNLIKMLILMQQIYV